MRVHNPTDKPIHVQYKGNHYVCPAGQSIDGVIAEAATYWKNMIHNFIIVSEEGVASEEAPSTPVEETSAPKEETVEEKTEEVKSKKKSK